MVRLTFLSNAAGTACLFTAIALAQPEPLTVDDVKSIYSDLTTQTQQINTTAKTIDPSYSFIQYGLFGSGPVKDFLDLLAQINTLLQSTTASLDESITAPIGSSTIKDGQNPPKEIYTLHKALTQEVRYEFRTIKKQSTNISCKFLGLITLSSCKTKAGEVRGALIDHKDALSDFRYAIQGYDFLYGTDIQDDWVLYTLGDVLAAIRMYDQFAPPEE